MLGVLKDTERLRALDCEDGFMNEYMNGVWDIGKGLDGCAL